MLNSRIKKLALGVSGALAMMWSPANAQVVANLQVFTNQPFANTAVELSYSFAGTYCCTNFNYNVGIGVEDDWSIESDIISQNNGKPPTGPYGMDVVFFSTPEIPERLARRYPQLVVGRPFPVAIDSLILYSPSMDISAGLPSPLTTQFVIPDPSQPYPDNFGVAATEILAQWSWRIRPRSIPNALVATNEGPVLTTFASIRLGKYPYGLINRASVCRADDSGNNQNFRAGFHHVYEPFGHHPYNPELVTVTAVHLARTRDAATTTAVNNLVAFLKGAKDSFGTAYQSGLNLIRSYCYDIPKPFGWEHVNLDH
jgi:molybdate transport system substrate-binding protein